MERINREDWIMEILSSLKKRSTCRRRQAAAVAFDSYGRIVGAGYNGVPRGFWHCTDTPCPGAKDAPGDTSRCEAIHAEANCIMNSHDVTEITSMYVTASPCFKCALLMANLPGLNLVGYIEEYPDQKGLDVLIRRGVTCRKLPTM